MDSERLDRMFGTALRIAPERRASWLNTACANDPELLLQLQRLLDADARGHGVLEQGAELISEVMAEAVPMPQHFGVWRVLRPLGAGGMGEVWLAERDDAGFVQRAAIKQVAWPTPGLLQRFHHERQILARLEHPNIARLIDGGVDDAGCPYLAMEYIEGTPISAWVRDQALDVRDTVKLLLHVCDCVQFAHRNLIVHSDIKPSNLLVNADGTPKLLDFGIARVLAEDGEATRTGTAARLLTPDYAAPELLASGAITTSVDVYALGVLIYELLACARPYRLAQRQAGGALPAVRPPSTAVAAGLADARPRRQAIRGDLDRIVLAAMAPEPAQRYASVEALAADLRCWLDGRAISVRGDNAWYQMRKFVARNRSAVTAAAAVLLALSAATVYSSYQARIARQQMHRAEAVRRFLDDTFARMDPAANKGKAVGMQELLRRSEQQLATASAMPIAVRADLTTLVGALYWNLADYAAAERALRSAAAMAAGGDVPAQVQARVLARLAQVEQDRGDYANAYSHAARAHALALEGAGRNASLAEDARRMLVALAIAHDGPARAESGLRDLLAEDRARHGDHSVQVVDDLIQIGRALDLLARHRESEAALAEAAATARVLGDAYRSRVGLALDMLGTTRLHRGDYAGATRAFGDSYAVISALWGEDNVRPSIVRGQLLEVAVQQGRAAESLPAVQGVLGEARELRRERPDHYASMATLLARAYLAMGRLGDAESAFRSAIALWKQVPQGAEAAGLADGMAGLAETLALSGRFDDAMAVCRQALAIERNATVMPLSTRERDHAAFGELLRLRGKHTEALRQLDAPTQTLDAVDSPVAVLVHAQRSQALLDSSQGEQARTEADTALAIADRVLPPGNWQRAPALRALGRAELALGRGSQAEAALRQALALHGKGLPATDPRRIEAQVGLVQALELQGKREQAEPLRGQLELAMAASPSPYLALLRRRLQAH